MDNASTSGGQTLGADLIYADAVAVADYTYATTSRTISPRYKPRFAAKRPAESSACTKTLAVGNAQSYQAAIHCEF